MRAVVAERAGGPEVLEVREVAVPQPGAGEVLIETHAVGVNFIEIYQRSGVYQVPFPFTPGTEAAGVVIAVGDGVDAISVGDRVITSQGTATYAEQFVAAADAVVVVPNDVDLELAATLPLQGCTAHYLSTSSSNPVEGDTVLVHAGAGGVGQLITQLLTSRGVRVLTTASTEEKRALSMEAGAAASFPYDSFVDEVRELTDGEGVAVVYDGVGATTFDGSLDSLQVRGTMVLFGGSSGQVPPLDLQRLNSGGSLTITRPSMIHFLRTPEERAWRYGELFAALNEGSLRPRISAKFALADAADAHEALASRGTAGKVLLVP